MLLQNRRREARFETRVAVEAQTERHTHMNTTAQHTTQHTYTHTTARLWKALEGFGRLWKRCCLAQAVGRPRGLLALAVPAAGQDHSAWPSAKVVILLRPPPSPFIRGFQ